MLYEDLIEVYGSASQAARYIGLTKQCVINWQRRGFIPLESQLLIQEATSGALKANKDHTRPYKPEKAPHQPRYRYYSEVFGMCPVTEIKFRRDRGPRIKFAVGDKIMYSFATEHLMQASPELDSEGNIVFEGDCVAYTQNNEQHIYKFLSMDGLRYLRNLKPYKIVGNIYETK